MIALHLPSKEVVPRGPLFKVDKQCCFRCHINQIHINVKQLTRSHFIPRALFLIGFLMAAAPVEAVSPLVESASQLSSSPSELTSSRPARSSSSTDTIQKEHEMEITITIETHDKIETQSSKRELSSYKQDQKKLQHLSPPPSKEKQINK